MRVLILLLSVSLLSFSYADVTAQSRLIEKLSRVQSQLSDDDSSKAAVTLRLADLLSERARFKSNKEFEKGCDVCTAGEEDRKQAAEYYTEVLDIIPDGNQKSQVYIQLGHMKEIKNDKLGARQDYKKAHQGAKSPSLKTEANFSLAEIEYRDRNFELARSYYDLVVQSPRGMGKKGYSAHKSAWATFSLGEYSKAKAQLKKQLETPFLITREEDSPSSVKDLEFQNELVKDYVTFVGKTQYSEADMKFIKKHSPAKEVNVNLGLLAGELERLGQKQAALTVLDDVKGRFKDPIIRSEYQLLSARLSREIGLKDKSIKDYKKARRNLSQNLSGCKKAECDELKNNFRNYVLSWHKEEKEKTKKSPQLIQAYEAYNSGGQPDIEFLFWQGDLEKESGQEQAAFGTWTKLVGHPWKSLTEDQKKIFEKVLLSQIEMAEKNKWYKKLPIAYDHYLAKSPLKTQSVEVSYQKAYLPYRMENYSQAAESLKAFAEEYAGKNELALTAADLALDAYVLEKNESGLIEAGQKFATIFPQERLRFESVLRKTAIEQSVKLASGGEDKNLEKAFKQLSQVSMEGADEPERYKIIRNKLVLARKLFKLRDVIRYADQLIQSPQITPADKDLAYTQKLWAHEQSFEFAEALKTLDHITKMSPTDIFYKKIMLSDLAEVSADKIIADYIRANPSKPETTELAMDLLKRSKGQSWALLREFRPQIEKNPKAFKQAVLMAYESTPDMNKLAEFISPTSTYSEPEFQLFQTEMKTPEFMTHVKTLETLKISSEDQTQMVNEIKAKAAAIKELEAYAEQVAGQNLWFLQLASIDALSKASKNFYEEIMSLPMPDDLSGDEQNQYMNMLSQQASPYLTRAENLEATVKELWNEKKQIKNKIKSIKEFDEILSEKAIQGFVLVKDIMPKDLQKELMRTQREVASAKAEKPEAQKESIKVAMKDIIKLRAKLVQKPRNKGLLEDLIELETERKDKNMLAYLKTRLQQLGKKN